LICHADIAGQILACQFKLLPTADDSTSNVFGLMNLLDVASEHECKSFIFISSDKAVKPCSVMGVTKRIGELIIARQRSAGLRCLSVRFGNVLGSNGSVIPALQQQLRRNEPLTVTHPDMKRFFMTVREAVSLVLQASVIGDSGDTLVLDMGEPIPILELVQTLIKLSGRNEKQVAIQFTGLRQGEKLIEDLFYENEQVDQTSFPKIKRACGLLQDWTRLACLLDELEATLFLNGSDSIRTKMKEIVPEYSYLSANETDVNEEESWPITARQRTA
jgi:FlaA1/EpsC-like NDP-sugar epimerase